MPGHQPIRDPKRVVAETLFREFSADPVVKATRNMEVPVTFEVPLSAQLARQAADLPASAVIALSIPQLANIPAGTAIAIRRDEPESFDRFKAALRAAIQERIDGQERDTPRGRLASPEPVKGSVPGTEQSALAGRAGLRDGPPRGWPAGFGRGSGCAPSRRPPRGGVITPSAGGKLTEARGGGHVAPRRRRDRATPGRRDGASAPT